MTAFVNKTKADKRQEVEAGSATTMSLVSETRTVDIERPTKRRPIRNGQIPQRHGQVKLLLLTGKTVATAQELYLTLDQLVAPYEPAS